MVTGRGDRGEDSMMAALDDDTVIGLFRYACETPDDAAADALEAEISRRGIYGRKAGAE